MGRARKTAAWLALVIAIGLVAQNCGEVREPARSGSATEGRTALVAACVLTLIPPNEAGRSIASTDSPEAAAANFITPGSTLKEPSHRGRNVVFAVWRDMDKHGYVVVKPSDRGWLVKGVNTCGGDWRTALREVLLDTRQKVVIPD